MKYDQIDFKQIKHLVYSLDIYNYIYIYIYIDIHWENGSLMCDNPISEDNPSHPGIHLASELFRGKTSKTIAVALHMRIFTGEKHEGYKDKLKIN